MLMINRNAGEAGGSLNQVQIILAGTLDVVMVDDKGSCRKSRVLLDLAR